MKIICLFSLLLMLTSQKKCGNKRAGNCYKGRLEIKGICMNYVIKVLDGDLSGLPVEKNWTDEESGKTYENVFGLDKPCDFPDLEEGEEFYFTLSGSAKSDCVVCQAFRPTPKTKNNIAVRKTPCR